MPWNEPGSSFLHRSRGNVIYPHVISGPLDARQRRSLPQRKAQSPTIDREEVNVPGICPRGYHPHRLIRGCTCRTRHWSHDPLDAFGDRQDLRKDWGFAALVEHDGHRNRAVRSATHSEPTGASARSAVCLRRSALSSPNGLGRTGSLNSYQAQCILTAPVDADRPAGVA